MAIGRLLHGSAPACAPGAIGHARAYEVVSRLLFAGRRRSVYARLVELSGARPGDRVLDVGCGTGFLTRLMAQAVAPTGSALGVDPSAPMVRYARERAGREPGCAFAEGLGEALGAGDRSFDVVVSSLTMHHIPAEQRPRALREMLRVLRPGGRLLIADLRLPAGRRARRLVSPVAGTDNPVYLLEPMVRDAGFGQVRSGDLPPFLRWVAGAKPTVSPGAGVAGR